MNKCQNYAFAVRTMDKTEEAFIPIGCEINNKMKFFASEIAFRGPKGPKKWPQKAHF